MPTASLRDSTPPPAPADRAEPRAGMVLGRYELLVPIARGGMAEVWIAEQSGQLGFKRKVALKTIRPEYAERAEFRRMFLEEARLASRIHHANVVEVLDLGEEGAIVYQAMALVEGDSLGGLLRRWRAKSEAGLPPPIVARILADAARGLHAAHEVTDEHGVALHLVHRDVTPQNVLVGLDGVAKIADFGIAKALGRVADETEAGQLKGNLGYLSPEQVARKAPDRRSDVFSAGVVLWEALSGARLFRGEDVLETLERLRALAVPDLPPSVPPALAAAAARALARDPEARFATAAAFADALEEAGAAPVKDVADLVSELAAADVERRREAVRRPRSVPPPAAADATIVDRPRRSLVVPAALAAAAALGVAAFFALRAPARPETPPAPATSGPAPAVASAEPPPPSAAPPKAEPSAGHPSRAPKSPRRSPSAIPHFPNPY